MGGGAQAKAELGPDLPTPGVQGQGGLAPRPPHPREGVVEGGGLRPVGVEAVVVHGGGGGGHDGGSFTAGPAILAACCLNAGRVGETSDLKEHWNYAVIEVPKFVTRWCLTNIFRKYSLS